MVKPFRSSSPITTPCGLSWVVAKSPKKKMGLLKILTLCHYAHEKGRMASFEK